jgi:hypothetical protein
MCGEFDHKTAPAVEERICSDNHSSCPQFIKRLERCLDFAVASDGKYASVPAPLSGGGLNLRNLVSRRLK